MKKFLRKLPTWAVVVLGTCWLVSGTYFAKILKETWPSFLLAMNVTTAAQWNLAVFGLFLLGLFLSACVGYLAWFGMSAGHACHRVLRDRLFG